MTREKEEITPEELEAEDSPGIDDAEARRLAGSDPPPQLLTEDSPAVTNGGAAGDDAG